MPRRSAGERPQFYALAGPQASGKTSTQENLVRVLDQNVTASYDGDDNAGIHPRYDALARAHGLDGHSVVSKALPNYHPQYLGHLRGEFGGEKYDVIASHPFGKPEWAEAWVDGFRKQGYETTVIFVTTHESNSRIGIPYRYQLERDQAGHGRWLDLKHLDDAYRNVPDVAAHLERNAVPGIPLAAQKGLVDHVYVVNRNGEVLYENHRGSDGAMENPLGAREAILRERSRAPTPEEVGRFESQVAYLRDPSNRTEPLDPKVLAAVDEAERQHMTLRQEGVVQPAVQRRTIAQAILDQASASTRQSTAKSSVPTFARAASASQSGSVPGDKQIDKDVVAGQAQGYVHRAGSSSGSSGSHRP
ncbi:zeta toxin family protein [Marinactinospora rubrisoli]|uniref:UDP-N-acetylglucosamine kinase n=1 Tax=Marinactinospora rubrisoli TaxID=2715399 RepID=A0ABW2KJ26_9ACTN